MQWLSLAGIAGGNGSVITKHIGLIVSFAMFAGLPLPKLAIYKSTIINIENQVLSGFCLVNPQPLASLNRQTLTQPCAQYVNIRLAV